MQPDTKIDAASAGNATGVGNATGIGTAVAGGMIYRGITIPDFEGKLVFADWNAAFVRPSGQLFRG